MDSNFGIGGHGSQSNAVKFYYSKRKESASASASASKELRRSASSRQVLSPPDPPSFGSNDELVAGSFYEIDHERLPPKSPIHLKAVRVVKVSETTKLDVTVCFPSTYSLRNYFSSIAAKSSSGHDDQTPELDEMFVMSTNHAGKILRRLVPTSQMKEEKHLQGFWLVAPFVLPNAAAAAESHDESDMPPASASGLQLALKYSGNLEWGLRRRVRYISRPPSAKREDDDESEHMDEVKKVICTRKRAREACKTMKKDRKEKAAVDERKEKMKIMKSKKKNPMYEKGEKVKCEQGESVRVRGSKDRWSTERYESAELKLLDIMKEKGAVLGSPILRQQLRDEARKHIGDTGLLDHLLKHMAGKVVNERSERFRRRHNADGAMEYWLEPAELDEVRKEAGVVDPFWLPPAGWMQGDAAASSACLCSSECQKEVSELKEEIGILRRDIEEFQELKQLKKEDTDQQQQQSEAAEIMEKYEMLVEKNKKLEEEMAELVDTLKGVKEEMLLLKQERTKREEEEDEERNKSVVEDAKVDGGSYGVGEGGACKINERRKGSVRSGFRICKPPGTFLWPNMASNINIVTSNGSSPAALLSMISNTTTNASSTIVSTTSPATAAATATAVIGSGSGLGGASVVPADHYAYQHYHQQQQLAMMFGGAGCGSGGGIPTPPSCSSTATSAPRPLLLPSPSTPRSSTSSSPSVPPQPVQQVVVPPLAVQHGNSSTLSSSSPTYCSLVAAVACASVGDQVKKGEDPLSSVHDGQAAAAATTTGTAKWSSSCNIATDLVLATPSTSSPYL